jgi:meso-butanediol dehydrogenase / (S,S)-butanediol dehydrogenase / diacetyl reductase
MPEDPPATAVSLDGTTALVVGGGSGIGAATALLFAERGARVVVCGPEGSGVEAVAEQAGGVAVVGDAADPEVSSRAAGSAVASWGRLDHLVSAAGVGTFGAVGDLGDGSWEATMRANVETGLSAARACLPHFVAAGRGSIALVSSLAGLLGVPSAAAYVASKHAVVGLARSLAVDYGPSGVRANAVCPGLVRTSMADAVMDVLGGPRGLTREDSYRRAAGVTPLRRYAEPRDIAEVIVFLAGPGAAVITGQTIVADCGAAAADSSLSAAFPA